MTKITKTRTETTLYDTNGKKISLVRKEIVEIDTDLHYLSRRDGKQIKAQGEKIRQRIQANLNTKEMFIKTSGAKTGQRIFCDMAEQIMVVERPDKTIITIPKSSTPSAAHLIWEVANMVRSEFQQSPSRRNKRKRS
jgi:ElaB/YqjD/DUF883 family membrane-anchored ribosome-binding protein